jgi:hypothetical protein
MPPTLALAPPSRIAAIDNAPDEQERAAHVHLEVLSVVADGVTCSQDCLFDKPQDNTLGSSDHLIFRSSDLPDMQF